MIVTELISHLEHGAKANREDRFREGNIVHLPSEGEVIMTGDLHGQEDNYDKLARYANLEENPQRHLILHELLHCARPVYPNQCHSYNLVARAAALKAAFPNQVHIILGNHAMAQVSRNEVLKNGQAMVQSLTTGLCVTYAEKAGAALDALDEFILSLPLAIRTDNRVWMSHSLPSMKHLAGFDDFIFEKVLTMDDMRANRSLRALTWDRFHSEECIDQLQRMFDVDMFIVGHQSQVNGYKRAHQRLIILASDHEHGCFLPFKLNETYPPDELFMCIRPLAALP